MNEEKKTKIVAIDYDDTYTACPEMFNQLIKLLKKYDFIPVCVTARELTKESYAEIRTNLPDISIYHTEHRQKEQFMLERGIKVDIWIDDNPHAIADIEKVAERLEKFKCLE